MTPLLVFLLAATILGGQGAQTPSSASAPPSTGTSMGNEKAPTGPTPRTPEGKVDFAQDFFGCETFLTVSGQLNVECYCLALSKVYTFGPTFRAENSNTSRHLAEFWMIEPEIAFADLADNAALAEALLKYTFAVLLNAPTTSGLPWRRWAFNRRRPQPRSTCS